MLSNGENVSWITQVFDTMLELTMLSPARPERIDVHFLPIARHPTPVGHALCQAVTKALKRSSCQSIRVQKSFKKQTQTSMTVSFGEARNTDWQCSVGWIRDFHFVLNSIIIYKGWHPKLIAAFPHEGIICTSQFPGHVYSVPHVQSSSNMLKYCKLDEYKKEKKKGKI